MIINSTPNPEAIVVHKIAKLFSGIGVVAGGCVASVYNKTPINDIDLFITSPVSLSSILDKLSPYCRSINHQKRITKTAKYSEYYNLQVPTIFDEYMEVELNVIHNGDTSIDSVINDFDFKNCMVWWDVKQARPAGLLNHASRGSTLRLNNIKHPIKLIERIAKYTAKGYRITSTTTEELNLAIAEWYYTHPSKDAISDALVDGLCGYFDYGFNVRVR